MGSAAGSSNAAPGVNRVDGSLAALSARNVWRGISGPHATARRVSVARPLVTPAHICVSASTSDRVLPDSYGDDPLTDPGAAEDGSAGHSIPSEPSHALLPHRRRHQAHEQFADD